MTMGATRLSGTAPSALEGTDLDALRWQGLADRLQAVAEPTRLRLLALLRALPGQRT